MTKTAVVAVGGNALILDKKKAGVEYQIEAVRETAKHIADMIQQGWNVVVTHGNGPQVGFILRRNELAEGEVHTTPLDVIGADTQGSIGYMLQQALGNEFLKRGIQKTAATVITQTVVDNADPAFQNPDKGIGGFMDEDRARQFEADGWTVAEDAGRGWRRMIASPEPVRIVEQDAIQGLVAQGMIVIAVGGGGIPVYEDEKGNLHGTRAVIDKDRATSLLARNINADLLLISTAVEKVALNFNTPEEKWLDRMTLAEARQYMAEGHFKPGSMLPKIQAIVAFLENGGETALITDPPNIVRALNGETGTWITRE
ncbi:MAG: carbamate kinase [Anaerolineae bacterium]|nr:carbamate kinase [Anaerolineae bacterium]